MRDINKPLEPFKFWAQKVLPLVYDDSLSYYEVLCKVVEYLNETIDNVDNMHTEVTGLHEAYVQLQNYVNTYFDNLDVQAEINAKLDEMATDGSLSALISPLIPPAVTDWLDDNITPTSPPVDSTLTVSGAAADAKVTGDQIGDLNNDLKITPIVMTEGAYVRTAAAIGSAVELTPIANANFEYAIVNCSQGDVFTINSSGTTNARSIAFVDGENKAIYVSLGNTTYHSIVTAPENAVKLIVNNRLSDGSDFVSYYGIKNAIDYLLDETNVLTDIPYNTALDEKQININWEVGSIDNVGILISSRILIRSNEIIVNGNDSITVYLPYNENLRCIFFYFSNKKAYIGNSGYLGNAVANSIITPNECRYVRILVGYKNATQFEEVPEFVNNIHVYYKSYLKDSVSSSISSKVDLSAKLLHPVYEMGDIDINNGGIPASSSITIRTKDFIDLANIDVFVVQPIGAARYRVFLYDDSFTFIKTSGYLDRVVSYTREDARYIKLGLRRVDNGNISDIDEVVANYNVFSVTNIAEKSYTLKAYTGSMICISHRGTRLTRPDSTSAAYIRAAECGFRYAEGDLERTSDGHYVLGHDNNILNRTGIDKNISETTLAELKTIDFGSYLFPEYAGQAILTLEEFLILCNNLGITPVLDFKTKTEEQVAEIFGILDKYALPIYNINGDLNTVKRVLAIRPDQFVRRSYNAYNATAVNEINDIMTTYPNCKFMVAYNIAYTSGTNGWTPEILENLVERGITVCPYEINTTRNVDENIINNSAYYMHNLMCGSEFNPSVYLRHRDNNILIQT